MLFVPKCETEKVPLSYNNLIKNWGCWILNMFSLSMCHSAIYHKLPHLYYKYSHLSSLRNPSFFTVVLESIGWVYFQGSSLQKLTSLGLRQLLKEKWWVARCWSCSQTAAFMQSNPARHTGGFVLLIYINFNRVMCSRHGDDCEAAFVTLGRPQCQTQGVLLLDQMQVVWGLKHLLLLEVNCSRSQEALWLFQITFTENIRCHHAAAICSGIKLKPWNIQVWKP